MARNRTPIFRAVIFLPSNFKYRPPSTMGSERGLLFETFNQLKINRYEEIYQ